MNVLGTQHLRVEYPAYSVKLELSNQRVIDNARGMEDAAQRHRKSFGFAQSPGGTVGRRHSGGEGDDIGAACPQSVELFSRSLAGPAHQNQMAGAETDQPFGGCQSKPAETARDKIGSIRLYQLGDAAGGFDLA